MKLVDGKGTQVPHKKNTYPMVAVASVGVIRVCFGYVDKSSQPLKQNCIFNQLPLLELLFCPGISSLLMLLKCKLFGVEIEAICF